MGCCILGALIISDLLVLYRVFKRYRTALLAALGILTGTSAAAAVLVFAAPDTSTGAYVFQIDCAGLDASRASANAAR